jgi:hypothetical protein
MIDRVQAHLEAIYGIRCEERASAYVVGPEVARALGGTGRADEELLVSEEGEELSVALYLSPELLQRLAHFEDAPDSSVLDRALGSYCELAEGVSHFLYVIRAAQGDRTVSLLELEAQAEVDKFASCALLRWNEGAAWARSLIDRLFHECSLRPGLDEAERWRYTEASRLARNYCRRLLRQISEHRMDLLLAELRHSYRLGAEAKLDYLARAA